MKRVLTYLFYAGLLGYAALAQEPVPQIVPQLGGDISSMSKVAFGSDGKWLAVYDNNGRARVYDLIGGRLARVLETGGTLVAIHPSKPALAAITPSGQMTLYDVVSGAQIWSVATMPCTVLQFAEDGSKLYGGCREPASGRRASKPLIKTWDADSGRELPPVPVPEGIFSIGAFSADGRWFAGTHVPSAFSQFINTRNPPSIKLLVMETESGKKIGEIQASAIFGLSAKARRAVVFSAEGMMLWNADTGEQTLVAPTSVFTGGYYSSSISADGSQAVMAGVGLKILDLATGQLKNIAVDRMPLAYGVALSPDHDHVALAEAGNLLLLSLSNPSERRVIGNPSGKMISADALPIYDPTYESAFSHMSQKERRRIIDDYGKKIMKAKPAERTRLLVELNRLEKGDLEARKAVEDEANKRAAEEYTASMSKFGGPSITGGAAFLESGRVLAVRAADNWWDVWDVTTGNRLPFRKASDFENYKTRPGDILNADELRDLEAMLTGHPSSKAAPVSPPANPDSGTKFDLRSVTVGRGASGVACRSEDNAHWIDIAREGDHLISAVLRAAEDPRGVDLVAKGVDLSMWGPIPPPGKSTNHPYICSLNRDATRLIVESPMPGREAERRSKIAKVFAPKMEDYMGKTTSENLTLYEAQTGRKLCALENAPNKSTFDVLADELQFSPDGKLIIGGGGNNVYAQTGQARRDLHLWNASTCKRLPIVTDEAAKLVGFSADGLQFFTSRQPNSSSTDAYGMRVWDAVAASVAQPFPLKPLFEMQDAVASTKLLTVAPSGKVLIASDRDHALGFWDRRTGEKLGSLRALQEGEWLATTPSGLFDGSPRGWTTIAWRDSSADITTRPGEIFFNEFYRPGLVAELLEGRKPSAPHTIAQVDRRQPTVSITTTSAETAERTVTVRIAVEEAPATAASPRPSGARDLRLFRNGSLVNAWRGELSLNQGRTTFEAVVPIRSGPNKLTAYVFNRDNVKSRDAVVEVKSSAPPRTGTAYILSIGVNQYANPEFNLNFAAPDASRLAEMLAKTERELDAYSKVTTVQLLNERATRANVLLALARLGGQQKGALPAGAPAELAALEHVEPEDTVVVFFAGHGTASGDRFYLIPHDLGYNGPRASLRSSLETILGSSISDLDLERAFEPVDAANVMLIIDACNSGKALDAEEDRRGPLNSKGLAQLAYEKGMYVLTAAQAYQAALESSRLGHGYLTYALAEEGLTSSAADVKPADGQITAIEWFEYASRRVPQLQIEALQEAASKNRLLVFDNAAAAEGSNRLQMPRLYYRRDDSTPSPVVAKR